MAAALDNGPRCQSVLIKTKSQLTDLAKEYCVIWDVPRPECWMWAISLILSPFFTRPFIQFRFMTQSADHSLFPSSQISASF